MTSKPQEFRVALYGCPADASLETVKSLASSAFGPFPSLPSRRFQAPLSPSFPWIVSFDEARTAQAFVRAHHEVVRSGSGKGTGDDQVFWDCWIGWQGISLKVMLLGKDGKIPKLASTRPPISTSSPSLKHPLPPRPRISTPPQPSPNSSSVLAPSNTQVDSPPRSTRVYSSSLFFPDKSASPSPQSSPPKVSLSKKRSLDSPSLQPALRGVPFIKRMRVISPTEVENEVKIESLEVVLEEVPTPEPSPKGGSTSEGVIERTTTMSSAYRREEEVASNIRAAFAEDAFERAEGEPPRRRPYFKAKGISSGEWGSYGQEAIQKASSRLSSVIHDSPPSPAALQDGVRRLVEGLGTNVPLPVTSQSLLLSPLIIVQPAPAPAPDLLLAFEPSRLQAQPSSSSYPSPAATPTNPFSLDYPRSLFPDPRNPGKSILVRPNGASQYPELAHLKVPRKTVRFGSCPPL